MSVKKDKIIREFSEDISILAGKRKTLFENMRKLYPKGKEDKQLDFCLNLNESRLDYYINSLFNFNKKIK